MGSPNYFQIKFPQYANNCLSLTITTSSPAHQLGHVLPDMSLAWPGHLQVGPQAPCLRYLSVKRSKQSPSMTLNDCLTAASGAGGQRRCQLPRWLTLKLGTAEVQPSDGFAFERNIEAVCDFGGGLTCYCDPPPCGLKLQLPGFGTHTRTHAHTGVISNASFS